MSNKPAEILTTAINELKKGGGTPQQISTQLLGSAVAVLVESIGTTETAKFLHDFADAVEATPELDNVVN